MGEEVSIIGVSVIGACGIIICLTVAGVMIIRAFRGGGSADDRYGNAGDSRLTQELHAGLMRMESRIESLETILMDRIERKSGAGVESEPKS